LVLHGRWVTVINKRWTYPIWLLLVAVAVVVQAAVVVVLGVLFQILSFLPQTVIR